MSSQSQSIKMFGTILSNIRKKRDFNFHRMFEGFVSSVYDLRKDKHEDAASTILR